MIRPHELRKPFRVTISPNVETTTTLLWDTLEASESGNLEKLRSLLSGCPELAYGQYNYTPPIHLAVREGHWEMVRYLLDLGALDPGYRTYPFLDTLLTIARDRQFESIVNLLEDYMSNPDRCRFRGDNGVIEYERTNEEQEFENAIDKGETDRAERMLLSNPDLLLNDSFFWSEGLLMMPAKDGNKEMLEMLINHGAKVPTLSKWGRNYYFKHFEIASFLLEKGMDANHMTWQRVTLLHDMAQSADLQKAGLLIDHGARMDCIDEEYLSTPLGLAARWGHQEMVEFLLRRGADPNKAGAAWSTPLAWSTGKGHAVIADLLRRSGAES